MCQTLDHDLLKGGVAQPCCAQEGRRMQQRAAEAEAADMAAAAAKLEAARDLMASVVAGGALAVGRLTCSGRGQLHAGTASPAPWIRA